jgi:hypothetical protein
MMRLFLAPHHDDALLSLAGHLLANKSSGNSGNSHVAVVFSRESRQLEETCTRLHSTLGLSLHFLGFEEAIRRGVSLRNCLRTSRTVQQVSSDAIVKAVQARLREHIYLLQPSMIYCPLLPVHIDHALVRAAADGLQETKLIYYEDQPYASLHPRVLARERFGMIGVEGICRAQDIDVETLLHELKGIVPPQHLNRILLYYRTSGLRPSHILWRREGRNVNQTRPDSRS